MVVVRLEPAAEWLRVWFVPVHSALCLTVLNFTNLCIQSLSLVQLCCSCQSGCILSGLSSADLSANYQLSFFPGSLGVW